MQWRRQELQPADRPPTPSSGWSRLAKGPASNLAVAALGFLLDLVPFDRTHWNRNGVVEDEGPDEAQDELQLAVHNVR